MTAALAASGAITSEAAAAAMMGVLPVAVQQDHQPNQQLAQHQPHQQDPEQASATMWASRGDGSDLATQQADDGL